MAVNLKIVSQVVASGTPGPAGKSAYQIAVDNGFEGTESEWLKVLHPFKGWFDSVSELEEEHSAPSVGEYAYVKGATPSDPVKIYECSTEGSWSDSGRTVDTSTVQTFGSGEAVNDVNITDDSSDIEENNDKIPTAGAVADALGNVEFSTGEKVKNVGIDNEPTAGSNNLVKSGGVQNELALGAVYDVSAKNPTAGPNSDGKWESLSALLSDANINTIIPTAVRKGGMSIKFVQSSDNKYVQYFLTKNEWSASEADWEKINLEEEVSQLGQELEQKTGGFNRTITISSANPQSLITNVNIPSGTKLKINISSSTAVWSRIALFGNSVSWASRVWTADNIQNGVDYEYVAAVDITDISIYPISVSTYGQLTIAIRFDPTFINGKVDKSSLIQVLGFDENNIISQKTISQNLYRLFAGVIPRDLGKNKFVPSFIETGKKFTQNGVVENSSYNAYYYIPIDGNTTYELSGYLNSVPDNTYPVGSSSVYVQFLNENFEIVDAIPANTRSFTSPSTAKYINVSVGVTIDKVQLELGSVATAYEEPIFGNTKYQELLTLINQRSQDFSIAINKLNFVDSKNLIDINADDFAPGKIIANSSGKLDSNTAYNTTNFCRVTPSEKYTFSRGDTLATVAARFILFYDANKQAITSSYATSQTPPFTAPSNAYYVRLTYQIVSNPLPQLEAGEIPTEYQEYNLVIPQSKIQQVKKSSVVFDSLRNFGTISSGSSITLPIVHVQKNILLATKIVGQISTVNVGVGYMSASPNRDYNSRWLEITQTEIKLYGQFNDEPILYNTFTHGLTLDNETFVSIETTIGSGMNTKVSLTNSFGERFTQSFTSEWGVGQAFVHNGGTGTLDVTLSMMLRDITKHVWVFGDSYISFVSEQRWAYYAVEDGNIGFLSNNQPGLSPASAVVDLQNILTLGYVPVYLIWMLGMNGNGVEQLVDGVYQINTYQKTNIDAVVGLCESNGIIPIFTCIPTVPSYQKTGLCNYVRSLGYRYIDVANAVGTNENGEWTSGLLSRDNVHPTAAGARVIYGQILADVPEIGIKE